MEGTCERPSHTALLHQNKARLPLSRGKQRRMGRGEQRLYHIRIVAQIRQDHHYPTDLRVAKRALQCIVQGESKGMDSRSKELPARVGGGCFRLDIRGNPTPNPSPQAERGATPFLRPPASGEGRHIFSPRLRGD